MNAPKFLSSGDSAITVEFGNEISAEINACVHALDKALHKKNILGIVETVPTFRSLLIIYDPCITGGEKLKAKITKLCGDLEASSEGKKRIIEIPVLYGGEYGEDLKDVAEINKLTEDEVIKIHSGTDYLIYMLGFFLGIIYLNVASTRYVVDVGIWSEWFRSQYLGYDLKSFDYMWYVAQIRLLPAGGLAILGGTKFRKIAAYLFLLWAGLASGMILTSALLMLGVKGLILCVISMLPHFLCYIPAYAMLLLYLFRYPVSEWNSTKTLSFVLFLTMGIALECLVNPVLLKMFLRTL
mgnify:CR=1 FL=1